MTRQRLLGPALAAMLACSLTVALPGCGSPDGDDSFGSSAYPFAFEYPASWTLARSLPTSTGHGTVTVALREPLDQIQLTSFTMAKSIPRGEVASQSAIDAIIRRIAKRDDLKARAVEYGGISGYRYAVDYPARPGLRLEGQLTVLFAGRTELLINCQSTPEARKEVTAGCQKVLNSLELRRPSQTHLPAS